MKWRYQNCSRSHEEEPQIFDDTLVLLVQLCVYATQRIDRAGALTMDVISSAIVRNSEGEGVWNGRCSPISDSGV